MRTRRIISLAVGILACACAPAASAAEGDSPLDWRLQELTGQELRNASPASQGDAVSLAPRGAGSLLRFGDQLVVEVRVAGSMATEAAALEAAGTKVLNRSGAYDTITVAVDEPDLRALAAVPGVESAVVQITPMGGSRANGAADGGVGAINSCATGTVSEGDAQLRAAQARTQFDVDGTGVKVGILSDTYDTKPTGINASNDVATGDLPGVGNPCGRTTPVQVVQDTSACGGGCIDEGRAMLQIVHDLAPGASLAFATAFLGQQAYADNIRALANNGAEVIADDYIYFREAQYQDGVIAKAINDVTAQGVGYYTMAYNSNRTIGGVPVNSWEAPAYRPTTCPAAPIPAGGDCMDFDPAGATDATFGFGVTGTTTVRITMDWAEPQFGVSTNLDLFLLNDTGTTIVAQSIDNNATTQAPNEFIAPSLASGNYQLVIRRASGTGTPQLKWINSDNLGSGFTSIEYTAANSTDTFGPTIFGHNGAANAQTVGAVPFNNPDAIEPFSAHGPVTHLFGPVSGVTPAPALASPEVLNKPEVSATDRTLNTFFGPGNRFVGTSASAPHAAAIAALQMEANPALTQAQVKANQRTNAVSLPGFGTNIGGAGRLDALGAIAAAPPTAPSVSLNGGGATTKTPPAIGFTVNGKAKTVTCAVDGAAAAPCTSPFTPTVSADGTHTVTVTVTDFFGRSASGSTSFATDTSTKISFAKGPDRKTKKRKAKFTIDAEAGAKLECKLDKEGFKPCSSHPKFKVKPGKHALAVHATDAAGNAADAKYKWKVSG